MNKKQLMNGSHIIGEAAVRAGCRFYAGYPITPQNELTEYAAAAMAKTSDGTFIQAESEIAAINMVIGAAMAGARAMTSSSSPGISLKQEGLSFAAAMELPMLVVNTMRGGPGLGNIAPTQGDYFQATRGGGHGDYRTIVLAPASGQELADLTRQAFDFADRYRIPVLIIGDGMMGQMREPVEFPDFLDLHALPAKTWVLNGARGRASRVIKSLILDVDQMEAHNWNLFKKQEIITAEISACETYETLDAEMVVIAYGTAARIAKGAVKKVREKGLKVGLLRPITLWPFPDEALQGLTSAVQDLLVFEMSTGQMLEDVKLASRFKRRIHFYGRPGGIIPTPDEVAEKIHDIYRHRVLGEA